LSTKKKKNNFTKRRYVLIGTNIYTNVKEKKLEPNNPDFMPVLKKNSEEFKKQRKNDDVGNALKELSEINKPEDLISNGIKAAIKEATIEELANAIQKDYKFTHKIKPLQVLRIAEPFEELRNASLAYKDKNGHLPKVFLLPMGPLAQNKARTDFSKSFFEIGGFDVIYKQRFHTVESAIDMALKSDAKIAVICSTDETYPDLVPAITQGIKEIKNDVMIILAGYPKHHVLQFEENGIDEFIFLGADVYQILKNIMIRTGVIQ